MATIDAYLKALLTLSGNEQLATARQNLLQGLTDDNLLELLKKAAKREFARGGLEEIISVILDVIARDPASVNDDGTSVSHATASLSMEQVQENDIQQQSLSEITVINDQPALSGPAMSVASKRAPPPSPGAVISKRSRLNTPPVVATQATAPARNVSLRDYETEQIIDNKIVPPIEIVAYEVDYAGYEDFNLTTLLGSKFDEDYLSTDLHVSEWGKLLRLCEEGVATGCCVNETIIWRAQKPGRRSGNIDEACNYCINTNRLCARLEQADGKIALVFCPLPQESRRGATLDSLDYWVRERELPGELGWEL